MRSLMNGITLALVLVVAALGPAGCRGNEGMHAAREAAVASAQPAATMDKNVFHINQAV